jgi:hypothetical protein
MAELISALILVEFTDPEGIQVKDLEPGDEVDEGVADMVAQDACEVIESHYRVKATVVRGFGRLEAIARQILNDVYPADVFGTADDPDSDASDPGVRLVRALRACEQAAASGRGDST